MRKFIHIFISVFVLFACTKDDDITVENPQIPGIELDSETAIYAVKVGTEFTINPTYTNAENAIYTWKLDGQVISTDPSITYKFDEINDTYNGMDEYYFTIQVTTKHGSNSDELKVEVSELAPPVISLVVPPTGLYVEAGRKYEFSPDVQNGDEAVYKWKLNGEVVGNTKNYTFLKNEIGVYELVLFAENQDGTAMKNISVNVIDKIPVEIKFHEPMYGLYDEKIIKYIPLGRTIWLRPYIFNAKSPSYQWKTAEGENIPDAINLLYGFTPDKKGETKLIFTVTDFDPEVQDNVKSISRNITSSGETETSIEITVVCCDEEGSNYRQADNFSASGVTDVLEFVAAPGQFVNEYYTASTIPEANSYALECLTNGTYISLGGFGGYVIVKMDHSIDNIHGQYNFSILGNQFEGSSEPGIVWVSQDTNNNGLPDDEWYELKGSEYGLDCTRQFYAVTYYRPEGTRMDTPWVDIYGNAGCVDYLIEYHKQFYYYPEWIENNSYTLYGPCLEARNYLDPDKAASAGSGQYWINPSYEWGYADNCGSDRINGTNWVGFEIANAVNLDGSPANLQYADFIKVQNALNTKSGWLGEASTEVFGFNDENINKTE
ncbi:MAG: cell surface protein [Rikenellaceae bacterium]|nr:cell surface protein [Rikenellaceae bacterium]